jgi:hypothetical protein
MRQARSGIQPPPLCRQQVIEPRQSGRTTRMMGEAVAQWWAGRPVLVVVRTNDEATRLKGQFREQLKGTEVQVKSVGDIQRLINWDDLRVKGWPENSAILVDPDVLISRFNPIITQYLAYDTEAARLLYDEGRLPVKRTQP